jgi:two-component system, cell cycle sensor histidine kinase and response regulator CckA
MDLVGRVTMWNEAATRTFGWSESEALGFLPRFVQEDRREEFREELARAYQEGGFHGVEFDRQRRDGSAISIRVSSALLRSSHGEVVGILAAAEDVTSERLAAKARDRLKRLESLGVLAGGIAHDFNNILMGIMGNLSLVQHEDDPTLRAHLLDEAQAAAEQAVGLTAQLVTFSKGGAPVKESLDLRTFLVEAVRRAAEGSPVVPEYDLQATPRVEADPVQLREVIESLVANAVEAMPDGGSLRITLDEYPDADGTRFARFAVSDTGTGIEPEVLEHIFDPYFTTKDGGTGLGLSLGQSIIAQHGGELTVASKDGVTVFTVSLPAAVAAAAERAQEITGGGRDERPARVLVVDDEDMIRVILVRMLERLGCIAVPCASGEEAVGVLRQAVDEGEGFAIAITDLTMPGGMGGAETTKALLAIDPTLKVVVSSGYSDDPVMARFRDYGFVASVRKPYTLDALRQTLVACCELRPG